MSMWRNQPIESSIFLPACNGNRKSLLVGKISLGTRYCDTVSRPHCRRRPTPLPRFLPAAAPQNSRSQIQPCTVNTMIEPLKRRVHREMKKGPSNILIVNLSVLSCVTAWEDGARLLRIKAAGLAGDLVYGSANFCQLRTRK